MISGNIIKYFDEAIKVELNASKIYAIFSQKFPEDKSFWWSLSLEEINHASLLESEKIFYEVNVSPDELFSVDLEELININDSLQKIILQFKDNISSENAFKIALEIENSAMELNYQKLAESAKSSRAINLFKELNRADKNHAKRILDYMNNRK
jgi:rubrerythrin